MSVKTSSAGRHLYRIEEGTKLLIFFFFFKLVLALAGIGKVNNRNPGVPHKDVLASDVPMKNIGPMDQFECSQSGFTVF
jgi:hypothetical protein